ncbi:MAG: NAD-dependent epimerase/dehydratase family protein [Ketobacteraceae bacterium]|nr:NAD-dependent epimerase/dehydratase family protein [Ketobacteraceae bacterium]
MKVLVTGASGFLGSHIVDACLEKGHKVRVIVRPSSDLSYLNTLKDQIEILSGDFTDADFLAQAMESLDAVIHSAARVTDTGHRDLFVEANVTITEKLMAVARHKGVSRFVFVSSPSVVAELKGQENIDETYPFPDTFLNYYCETKAIAEQKVISANGHDFITCSLRPRAIWGPRDTSGPFVKFMKKMQQGKLKDLSGGRKIYSSICYVKNAAEACVAALTANNIGGKTYFITDEEIVDLWQFADQMADAFQIPGVGKPAPLSLVSAIVNIIEVLWKFPYLRDNVSPPLSKYSLGLITHTATYSIENAKRDLGYQATIKQAQAIAEYRDWVNRIGGIDTYLRGVG